jgi:hypothetical protein
MGSCLTQVVNSRYPLADYYYISEMIMWKDDRNMGTVIIWLSSEENRTR